MSVKANTILTRQDWDNQREQAFKDPGKFHGDIAKREIFWFESSLNAWIKQIKGPTGLQWIGFKADTGAPLSDIPLSLDYNPWRLSFNQDEAPFYRWFEGGLTNACFNEVDAHVLAGRGNEIAFIFEGDRFDSSLNEGHGGAVNRKLVTRKQLLLEVAKYAILLQNLGLKQGDRIVINMPNILEQIYFIEAAKRLGIIYVCVFGGFSAKTLSDRIEDAGAKVVITTDGAYREAKLVSFKEKFINKALDDYIPVSTAIQRLTYVLKNIPEMDSKTADEIIQVASSTVKDEITIEPSDLMRGVGNALEMNSKWSASTKSKIRIAIAEALVQPAERVETVVVVNHVQLEDIPWNDSRDRWASTLLVEATKLLIEGARKKGISVTTEEELLNLPLDSFVQAIYTTIPPVIVDAEFPLFIIYTSGSTGKPKGLVHTHGGYVAGIAHTMQIVFDIPDKTLDPENRDVIYVIADPGWITGQSYMISAALTTGTTSVIAEGSPLFPNAGRFTSIIEQDHVTILKAGSTFLKSVAADPQNTLDVEHYDRSSLRIATFCAEPTNPAIQEFGMKLLTPNYINSYWATEHGGIVLTHFYGNKDFPLRANAFVFPLPWIFSDVWIAEKDYEGHGSRGSRSDYRSGNEGEKGEFVITRPYPYLARTIWGDVDRVGSPEWRGDAVRFAQTYFDHWSTPGSKGETVEWVFTLGDFGCKHPGEGVTLHGRSDDVINTSGHRIGTEEIESALLKEKLSNPQGPIANVIVVGAPHEKKGTVPVAFLMIKKNQHLNLLDERRLIGLVREEKGAIAVPAGFICVSQFPETRSGKYMRRFLSKMLEGEPLGDTSSLKNPECLKEIAAAIKSWQRKTQLENSQEVLQIYSTLRVEYHALTPTDQIAVITLNRPPVNALDERALDELNLVAEHLERREEIRVIILTGAGTQAFVSGADIRQFLEEMHSLQDVLPLTHKAAEVTKRFEKMNKPVIAAINGLALGGGNELQMAAHYRIAEPTAKFGQPEINLNLIPGYGGTQRLPRLLEAKQGSEGLVDAAHLILSGRSISAEKALEIGLIHEVVFEKDVLIRATELARQYILEGKGPLAKAHQERVSSILDWETPRKFPIEMFEQNPELKKLCMQLSERTLPMQWAIEAMKYGYEQGFSKGIEKESQLFAEAVIHPQGGKAGIQAFFDKNTLPLPLKRTGDLKKLFLKEKELLRVKKLLPIGSPFYCGVTPIPEFQYAFLVEKDDKSGKAHHGDPEDAECKRIIPVPKQGPNEVLLYMLTSEINFNDIWAITGVPVSPFDLHDEDWHVTGSGGLGLVVATGTEVRKEGRVKIGDVVAVFSGQSRLLSPTAGLDPMFADQSIQGYETPDGSHQQFMNVQAPQVHPMLPDLTLEAAGSYMLNLGTIYRALYKTLNIESGKTLFVEGASTGTGLEAVKAGSRSQLKVIGLVSSKERAEIVIQQGGIGAINRKNPNIASIFTPVPENSAEWEAWEAAGTPFLEEFKKLNHGNLADYAISHAGQDTFPRSFQLLKQGGTLTFFGASAGYHFTFMGKTGSIQPEEILKRAQLQPGENVLIFYGTKDESILDEKGLECIEAARELRARIVVCTMHDSQREFVRSMGFGESILGIFSVDELKHRKGHRFVWPKTMPPLPNPKTEPKAFKEAVRWYQEFVFKPFASHVGPLFKSLSDARGNPDLIIERADQDTLALSSMLIKPYTGRVVYFEDMSKKRYSFYAPQVWMRQRRIYMPTANIWGTHLSNSYEIQKLNQLIDAGFIQISEPLVIDFEDLPKGHQEMWENRHRAGNYILNHALPQLGLKTKDELYQAWSIFKHKGDE